ncbi:unnamed protein product [Adineta ricciae]|uniref:Uncharacterized protein n=1 Tax=Adineta ricciae TaxID=249248 RepID=A0A815N4L3_ADIRI|nr:unnamed protein product [Adineta ricciae]
MNNKKVDPAGNYLPCPGYTIVAHALHPLPAPLIELVTYLSSSELEHQSLLQLEQHKLQKQDTSSTCITEKLRCSKVLLIEVQFPDDDNHTFETILKNLRSDQLQQANILPKYTLSWHLTLAYQYKEIESDAVKFRLNHIISCIPRSAAMPFPIPLDQIRICHYNDMTKFTPI